MRTIGLLAVATLGLLAGGCGASSAPAAAGPSTPAQPVDETPSIQLSTSALAFTAVAGGPAPAAQTLTVANAGAGALLAPTADVTYQSGSGWLSATVAGESAPYLVTIQPSAGGLAAGTYSATLSISSAAAACAPQVVAITLTITPPADSVASIALSQGGIGFYSQVGAAGSPAAARLTVTGFGSGPMPAPSATVSYLTGSGWLAVAVAGNAAPYTVTVQPTAAGLAAGTYEATISLSADGAPNSPRTVAVRLTVAPVPVLQTVPASASFVATTGGAAPPPQVVTAKDASSGVAMETSSVRVDYGAGPTGWLSATPIATNAPYVTLQPAIAGLAAGTYSATVWISSNAVTSTPIAVPVTLTLTDPTGATMSLSTSSVEFTVAEGTNLSSRAVTVTGGGTAALLRPATSIAYERGADSGGWLSAAVVNGTPYGVALQASSAGLSPGLYKAFVTVASPGTPPRTIDVVLKVTRRVTVSRLCTAWAADGGKTTSACSLSTPSTSVTNTLVGTYAIPFQSPSPGVWVADVPAESFWLSLYEGDGRYRHVDVTGTSVDLGLDEGGRPGATIPYAPTRATFALTGLLPWAAGEDAILLTSWDAGLVHAQTPTATTGVTAASFAVDFAANDGLPLLSAGDDLVAMQVRTAATPAGGASYRRAVAAVSSSGVAMTEGATVTVRPGPLSVPSASAALRADWRHSQFEAGLPPRDGTTASAVHMLSVLAAPAPLAVPSPFRRGAVTPLVDVVIDGATSVPDTDYGALGYGRFLPARYQEYRFAGYVQTVNRAAPGASPVRLANYVVRYDDVAAAPAPVIPLVTGIQKLTIANRDAMSPQTGVGTQPFILWRPPALGEVTSYRVTLYELVASGGRTEARPISEHVTSRFIGRSPLLQAGRTYVVGVEAISSPGDALASASPWREGVPFGASMVYSQPFSP
jgi:hypothetical protein